VVGGGGWWWWWGRGEREGEREHTPQTKKEW